MTEEQKTMTPLEEAAENGLTPEGVCHTLAAMCHGLPGDKMTVDIEGLRWRDLRLGNWRVTVERRGNE